MNIRLAFIVHALRTAALRKYTVLSTVFVCMLCVFSVPISANAFSVTTRIGDKSTELRPGDRLYFDVEIKWPENAQRQDLRVEYQIVDNGQVIASEKVLRAVETQASFLDYIVVPQNTQAGMKDLAVVLQTYDGSLNKSVSASFHVAPPKDKYFFYFLALAGAIGLVVVLVVFQIMMMIRTQKMLAAQNIRL